MMFSTTSSRVGELGFDISWLFLGRKELGLRYSKKLRVRKISRFGLDVQFSLSVPLNRWGALSAMSRH